MLTAAAELLTGPGRADPYPIFRRLHALGPVVPIPGGAVVVGYAEAERALRDPRLLVEDADQLDRVDPGWREHRSRVLLNNAMVFSNGSTHERMRRLVGRAFTPKRVDGLRPAIAARVDRLLDRLAAKAGPTVDFVDEFTFPLPVDVIGDLLGIPDADRGGFRRPVADLATAFEPGWLGADLSAADRAAVELADYFGALIVHRGQRPGDDLLSAMVEANRASAEPLTRDQLVANAVFLLLAGFETTVGLLGNGLMLLLDRPHLRPDPAFVEEVLRYDAPVQLTGRRAAVDLRVGDITVPEGGSVVVLLGAANRDPRRFPDPDRFDVGRADNRPLSFSSGAHFCLGARLARLEATLALPAIVNRFPHLTPARDPARLDRFNLRAYGSLPLTLGSPAR